MGVTLVCGNVLPTFRAGEVNYPFLTGAIISITIFPTTRLAILHRVLFFIVMGTFFQVGTSAAPFIDGINAGAIVRPTNLTALTLQVLNPGMGFGILAVVFRCFAVIFFRLLNLAADVNPTGFCWRCDGIDRLFRLLG